MWTRWTNALGLILAAALVAVKADKVEERSFHEPFNALDSAGKRTVPGWQVSGDAQINEGFVRLTTDRQSKKGVVWNSVAIGAEEFSAVLQFRISGQGERFFGDGIGLWFIQSVSHPDGSFHGVRPEFNGVGIVLDTFKNTETAAHHKDVTILVNDGTRTQEQMQESSEGCDATLRYHEKRADFSPTNSSRIKIQYSAGMLRVSVDARANSEWQECATVPVLEKGLQAGWAAQAYAGVTASTGQLADNHDVLGLEMYNSADDQYADYKDEQVRHAARPLEEQHGGDQVEIVKSQMKILRKELEHQLSAVNEGLKHSLMKLKKQEELAEARIEKLEQQLANQISENVQAHVEAVKGEIHSDVADSMEARMSSVSNSITSTVSEHLKAGAGATGGWKMPFVVLFVVLVGAIGWFYSKYREFKKSHLL